MKTDWDARFLKGKPVKENAFLIFTAWNFLFFFLKPIYACYASRTKYIYIYIHTYGIEVDALTIKKIQRREII